MAISWLTVLQSVPWSEVISNAPKVADGAKKLWSTVSKKAAPPFAPETSVQPSLSPEAQAIGALEERVFRAEAAVADLHGQMLASSELIKALAEQNAQLIRRIENHRVRVKWLTVAVAIVAAISISALGLAVQ